MRYAILETGGKQYVAREGQTIEVDRLPMEIGKPVEFDQVLLAVNEKDILVGDPLVKGASVKAKVVDQIKAKKIIVFKYVPKQRYRRKAGHRQKYTRVVVDEISLPGGKKAAEKKSTKEKPAAEEKKTTKKASTKSTAKKSTAKKSTAKKSTAKKTTAKKSTAKKSTSKAEGKASTKKSSESKAKKSASAEKKSSASKKKSSSKSTKKSSDT